MHGSHPVTVSAAAPDAGFAEALRRRYARARTARSAWEKTGARLIECPTAGPHLDLPAAFRRLAAEGLTRILCEGGGTLAAHLITNHLADDLALYTAGCLIGADGTAALAPLGLTALNDAPRLTLTESQILGPDQFRLWTF